MSERERGVSATDDHLLPKQGPASKVWKGFGYKKSDLQHSTIAALQNMHENCQIVLNVETSNFSPLEAKIQHRVKHVYESADIYNLIM